jgi:hypothetical protein
MKTDRRKWSKKHLDYNNPCYHRILYPWLLWNFDIFPLATYEKEYPASLQFR